MLINPSAQHKALLEGLACISKVLVRTTMEEELYRRRWESKEDTNDKQDFSIAHKGYRDTLKALYVALLKYQATSLRYFNQNGSLRITSDMVKWNSWEDLLKDVKKQDEAMCLVYDRLTDVKGEEEFAKLDERHRETVDILKPGFSDVAALRKAIETAQKDKTRTRLLDWLSSVDPSENYNNARGRHEDGTGKWLIQDNEDIELWKTEPNSLLWLHGKGMTCDL